MFNSLKGLNQVPPKHGEESLQIAAFTGQMPFLLPNQQCQSTEVVL